VYVFSQLNATNLANKNIDSTPDYVVNVRENTTKEYFDLVIFENFTIKSDLNEEIVTTNKVINVIAFAVQTEGFENSEDVDVGAGVYGYTLAWNTTYGGGGLA
jgi:ssRNA-specific RNase YbeY (16S rRNA maturation enzyme)